MSECVRCGKYVDCVRALWSERRGNLLYPVPVPIPKRGTALVNLCFVCLAMWGKKP